ncbi:MAG TPA: ABC transporter permease [Casimicrobiaceae bacterium]|nr:ABC transporter permease [Casimicrobiaceae bacterium]
MSSVPVTGASQPTASTTSLSPNQRAWARFKRNRLGYVSLVVFVILLAVATVAEIVSNDRPFLARYDSNWYLPIISNPPEIRFGGDFKTPAEWHDPLIRANLAKGRNFAVFTLNEYGPDTLNYASAVPDPAPPGGGHWLGTDAEGRDVTARLLYGFRISVYFGFALTFAGTLLGIVVGALQGYFGGRVDLTTQRVIEIWNAIPELYLLIILASIFAPSLLLLLVVFTLFGWIALSDYVRAEFLRNRNLEFVRAARALGLSNRQIIVRHLLPNSMTPVITFLPFRMSAAILFLTSLDFLGLGVPDLPSLGGLLREGKENLDAWWISVPTFVVLVATLLLLTFVGDALRDAFDTRKS